MASPLPLQQKAPLALGVGEQRLLSLPGLKKYSIGQPLLLRAIPLPVGLQNAPTGLDRSRDLLLLKAIQVGTTDLWVWKEDGSGEHRSIRIEKYTHRAKTDSFEKALGGLQEVEVIWTPKGALLRGAVLTLSELESISALTQLFPKEVIDETSLSPGLLDLGEKKIQHWLKKRGSPLPLHLEKTPEGLWITGSVLHPQKKQALEKALLALFPKIHFDLQTLPDASPTIYFQVFLIELHQSAFQRWGLKWPSSLDQAFQITSGSFRSFFEITLALEQLETKGQGRVLSHPQLVVRSPGEAELFAGGEVPITTHTRSSTQVQWKKYGLTLKLKVQQSTAQKVRLDVFTEVSHLKNQSASLPSLGSNQLHTQVDATFGKPLFLSGLLQKQVSEEQEGLPWLNQLPILGALFRSETFQKNQSELIALLYPLASPPSSFSWKPHKTSLLPQGFIPIPRRWMSSEEEERLKNNADYPWNAFSEG